MVCSSGTARPSSHCHTALRLSPSLCDKALCEWPSASRVRRRARRNTALCCSVANGRRPLPSWPCFEALSEEIGGSHAWVRRMNDETLAIIRAQLDAADIKSAWEQGSKLTTEKAVALALDALDAMG